MNHGKAQSRRGIGRKRRWNSRPANDQPLAETGFVSCAMAKVVETIAGFSQPAGFEHASLRGSE